MQEIQIPESKSKSNCYFCGSAKPLETWCSCYRAERERRAFEAHAKRVLERFTRHGNAPR